MARLTDTDRGTRADMDSFAGGYFRNAVYRHWDPDEVDIAGDRRELLNYEASFTGEEFDMLRLAVARFGGGEEAVTEDLMPLGLALDGTDEQLFLTTQLYEEAKHTRFFDRYWEEVLTPVAEELGMDVTDPTDERYLNDDYVALFDAVEESMAALLDDRSPEARARAYSHYHIVAESVLAQTAYYSLQSAFSSSGDDDVVTRPPVGTAGPRRPRRGHRTDSLRRGSARRLRNAPSTEPHPRGRCRRNCRSGGAD
ncbi:hypothetical protein [Natronomonas sp. CBA1123]|uniref:hypothetical protein n=1 Tax=Natronomonas sp. CBA1123 TaxID=2668070 RepID=UPI001E3231D6|nr:hypothetical protein [Natronomonas sp. CBA1123]